MLKPAKKILDFTKGHPYYTQELSFYVWNEIKERNNTDKYLVDDVIDNTIVRKDYDYERLWAKITSSSKKLMKALASGYCNTLYTKSFLDATGFNATSTVRGCIKKLLKDGYIINDEINKEYRIEDPFFNRWIQKMF